MTADPRNGAAQAPRISISHTTRDVRDHAFASRISLALRDLGVRTWIAPDDIPAGADWEARSSRH